jgi:hypothetical protein
MCLRVVGSIQRLEVRSDMWSGARAFTLRSKSRTVEFISLQYEAIRGFQTGKKYDLLVLKDRCDIWIMTVCL